MSRRSYHIWFLVNRRNTPNTKIKTLKLRTIGNQHYKFQGSSDSYFQDKTSALRKISVRSQNQKGGPNFILVNKSSLDEEITF